MTDISLSNFVINAAVEPFKPLTPAEKRVADLVARGWAYKEIACRLRVSPRAVRHHIESVASKLPNEDNLSCYEVVQIWALCDAVRHLLPGEGSLSEIKPALTAEEWLRVPFLDWTTPDSDPMKSRHALAAMSLNRQPFGFTREMLDLLRAAIEVLSQEIDWQLSPYMTTHTGSNDRRTVAAIEIADRIEALLPPQ